MRHILAWCHLSGRNQNSPSCIHIEVLVIGSRCIEIENDFKPPDPLTRIKWRESRKGRQEERNSADEFVAFVVCLCQLLL